MQAVSSPDKVRELSERRAAAQRWERIGDSLPTTVGALAFLAGPIILAGSAAVGWLTGGLIERQLFITAIAATFFLGALVGATELVSRYADAPIKALGTGSGVFYVFVNAIAALTAFLVVDGYDLLGLRNTGVIARMSSEALLAGLGAMAFFRAAVFNVRVGSTDIAVGPASVLQIIIKAVDRAVDRNRAKPRARRASHLMSGINFKRAADILPQFCFDSMQNVSAEESQRVLEWVQLLKQNADIAEQQKTLLLGLKLMNIVGEEVLQSTLQGLGSAIREQLVISLSPAAMDVLKHLSFSQAVNELSALCQALTLGQQDDWLIEYLDVRIEEIRKAPDLDDVVKVMLLTSELIKYFGNDIFASALEMLTPLGPGATLMPQPTGQVVPLPGLDGEKQPLVVPKQADA